MCVDGWSINSQHNTCELVAFSTDFFYFYSELSSKFTKAHMACVHPCTPTGTSVFQKTANITGKRKRVNFDMSKNETVVVDRYILSNDRAKKNLSHVLNERVRAARVLQRAARRWLKNTELRIMLNSDRHSLQTFYDVGFTDAELSRYAAYHSSGRPMQYCGRPIAMNAPSKFATCIQRVVRGFLARCALKRKVDETLQKTVRRYLAKKKYLECGEQIYNAISVINSTDNAILSMQKTKKNAIPTIPLDEIDACIHAYKKYIRSANVTITNYQDIRNDLIRRVPRVVENMVSDGDIKSVFYDAQYGYMGKGGQVLRWLAQLFYRFRNNEHIPRGKHWSGVGTILDTLDYNVSIPLAIMFTQFKDSKTKSYDEVDNCIDPKPPVRCIQSYVPEVTKQKFRTLLSIFKSMSLSSPSINCTVCFNLTHVEQEVTSLARRLDISQYCFVNTDYLRKVPKIYRYSIDPGVETLRQKVGDQYTIVPLENGDHNMFINEQTKEQVNKRATDLAGFPVYGDVVIAGINKRKLNDTVQSATKRVGVHDVKDFLITFCQGLQDNGVIRLTDIPQKFHEPRAKALDDGSYSIDVTVTVTKTCFHGYYRQKMVEKKQHPKQLQNFNHAIIDMGLFSIVDKAKTNGYSAWQFNPHILLEEILTSLTSEEPATKRTRLEQEI